MYIKRRGLRYYLLRSSGEAVNGRKPQVIIGSFPMDIEDIEGVETELLAQLTKMERLKLEEHFEKRRLKREDTRLQKKKMRLAPGVVAEVADIVKQMEANRFSERVATPYLEAYRKLTKSLGAFGYGPELITIALNASEASLREFEIEPDQAQEMLHAMATVKDLLATRGYTFSWAKSKK